MATDKEVESVLMDVEEMYRMGAMPQEAYHKCMVSLAAEYLEHDDLDRCLELLNKCPPSYYMETQPQQADEDSMFAEVVIKMAYKLVKMGVVGMDLDVEPNMPEAEA